MISSEQEYERKRTIMMLVDNPEFQDMIQQIKRDLGEEMLIEEDNKVRDTIYQMNQAVDKVVEYMTSIANEVRVYNGTG